MAIGAIEPQFYKELLELCGLDETTFEPQMDPLCWPTLTRHLADMFKTKTRAEWCVLLEGTDACFSPILDWDEAPKHPHNVDRETFLAIDGVVQPAPAPRFSRTPAARPRSASAVDPNGESILRDWGLTPSLIEELKRTGAIRAG